MQEQEQHQRAKETKHILQGGPLRRVRVFVHRHSEHHRVPLQVCHVSLRAVSQYEAPHTN